MNEQALGLIETIGMTAAIEAADKCIKSANVQLVGYELSTGGLVTIKIQGDVGAVKSAINAAKTSASRLNEVISTLIIPRPASDIQYIVKSESTKGLSRKAKEKHKYCSEEKDNENTSKTDEKKDNKLLAREEIESEDNVNSENKIDKDNEQICNICKDSSCPRIKGQPRNWCINHKEEK